MNMNVVSQNSLWNSELAGCISMYVKESIMHAMEYNLIYRNDTRIYVPDDFDEITLHMFCGI